MQVNGYMVRISSTPEMKVVSNGSGDSQVANFSVANEEGWGEKKDTTFFDCTAWGKTANVICDHCKKGDPIIIEGLWKGHSYTDKNTGRRIKKMQYIVNKVIFPYKAKEPQEEEPRKYSPTAVGTPDVPYAAPGYSAGQGDDFAVIDDSSDLPF